MRADSGPVEGRVALDGLGNYHGGLLVAESTAGRREPPCVVVHEPTEVAEASMAHVLSDPPQSSRPTGIRYGVLAFAASLSMITYLDRVCISSGQSAIIHDLGLQSEADLKWVFALFTLAYSLFEVPTGWLGDVIGPRKVLIRIVLRWSFFTALTGAIGMRVGGIMLGGLVTLAIVRFLFGMGEAGAYPNITRALHNWFPYHERGLAQVFSSMHKEVLNGLLAQDKDQQAAEHLKKYRSSMTAADLDAADRLVEEVGRIKDWEKARRSGAAS